MRHISEVLADLMCSIGYDRSRLTGCQPSGDARTKIGNCIEIDNAGRERDGDGTGAREEIRPAPSPVLSGGDEAHASKGRIERPRRVRAPAGGAAREVGPRGSDGRAQRHETRP